MLNGQAGCDVHSHGAPNGLILVTNIPTLLVDREPSGGGTPKIADEFQSKTVGATKEFVTLLFLALAGELLGIRYDDKSKRADSSRSQWRRT